MAEWVVPASLLIALAVSAVSAYLTIAHFTRPDILACSTAATVNCEVVTTSPQSTFVGVPVAALGLGWFVGMAALSLPAAWAAEARSPHLVRLAASIGGVGFAVWLIYAELVIIGAICTWCTVAHVLAFGLFGITAKVSPSLLVP